MAARKCFLFAGLSLSDGQKCSNSAFWEWDPISAGWALTQQWRRRRFWLAPFPVVAYDNLRRRQVVPSNATITTGSTTTSKTWELDANRPSWYMRALSTGPTRSLRQPWPSTASAAWMVLFGAGPNDGSDLSETWEYRDNQSRQW